MVALFVAFSAEIVTSVRPFPVLQHLIVSSGWYNLCSCIQIIPILYLLDKYVNSYSLWLFLKDLMFIVAIFFVNLQINKDSFYLVCGKRFSPAAHFLIPTWWFFRGRAPCSPAWRAMRYGGIFFCLVIEFFIARWDLGSQLL